MLIINNEDEQVKTKCCIVCILSYIIVHHVIHAYMFSCRFGFENKFQDRDIFG